MSLKSTLTDAMKTAMKEKNTARLGTLRLILAAAKQREVDERIELTDADMIAILDKMMKQRRDSFSQYQAAGREDLAAQEHFEMDVLKEFLPQALSEAEIDSAIEVAILESGAASAKDMGKLMAILKPALAGKADMSVVSTRIKARLG